MELVDAEEWRRLSRIVGSVTSLADSAEYSCICVATDVRDVHGAPCLENDNDDASMRVLLPLLWYMACRMGSLRIRTFSE